MSTAASDSGKFSSRDRTDLQMDLTYYNMRILEPHSEAAGYEW